MNYCLTQFNNAKELEALLNRVVEKDRLTISYPNIKQLAEAYYKGEAEAKEEVQGVCSWVPGNLVIGLRKRTNDPEQNFDTFALNCRISIGNPSLDTYLNFDKNWRGNAQEKQGLFNNLIQIRPVSVEDRKTGNGKQCIW